MEIEEAEEARKGDLKEPHGQVTCYGIPDAVPRRHVIHLSDVRSRIKPHRPSEPWQPHYQPGSRR